MPARAFRPECGSLASVSCPRLAFSTVIHTVASSAGRDSIAVGVLRGLKDTRAPLAIAVGGYWVVGVPLGFVMAFYRDWGAAGIWIGILTGVAVTGMFCCVRLLAHLAGSRRETTGIFRSAEKQAVAAGS